jgi:hypothetical protein
MKNYEQEEICICQLYHLLLFRILEKLSKTYYTSLSELLLLRQKMCVNFVL